MANIERKLILDIDRNLISIVYETLLCTWLKFEKEN